MDIEVSHEVVREGAAIVRAVGELDVYTAGKWRNYTVELLKTDKPRHLGLDMSEVSYFDSMAVGGLVKIFKDHRDALGAAPGAFALIGCQERTRKIMRLTGLERLMPCVDSVGDFAALALAAEREPAVGGATAGTFVKDE